LDRIYRVRVVRLSIGAGNPLGRVGHHKLIAGDIRFHYCHALFTRHEAGRAYHVDQAEQLIDIVIGKLAKAQM
jgi:hypothetical protein